VSGPRPASSQVAIVHVGSAARDVTPDDPRGWRLGGGTTYSALATARLGIPTAAVIGVDGQAAGAWELDVLREAGVDVLPVALAEGPIFENVERPSGRQQTCLATGVPLPVPDLPEAWATDVWSVVPVAGEISDQWLAVVPRGSRLVLGWQGFLRRLVPGQRVAHVPPRADGWVPRAGLIGVSRNDLDPGLPLEWVTDLLSPGTDLILTNGRQGGDHLNVGPDGAVATAPYAAFPSANEIDATGAGDTFLAALVASSLRAELRTDPGARFDLRFAAAASSLVVEGHGLEGVPTLEAVRQRLATADLSVPPVA
jgi:pfkB family carbohydrate kinase